MSAPLAGIAATIVLAAAVTSPRAGTAGAEWPGFLGPDGNLRLDQPAVPGADGELSLRTRWKKPLGSGYSGIAVSGGLLYTLFTDGTDDWIVCLDAASGDERWRHALAPTWRGLHGSLDGPMSTPAVAADLVVGLGPRGQLVALDRLTGAPRWKVDLVLAHRAAAAVYGFATSPLIDDGKRVVIQAGGRPAASIIAFDLETGAVVWTAGSEPVEYQSAARMPLAGRPQLIGITDTWLRGIEPESGRVLWSERYLERPQDAGAHAISTAPDRFLVNTRTGALHYEVEATPPPAGSGPGPGFAVRQMWASRELGQSYTIPIYHDGSIYGYSGEFLTCIDAETGKRAWKSRPPGKGALMLLGDLLIAWGIDGRLTLIDATPGAYRERTALQVLDVGSITPPAYAERDRTLYVRNHLEIAAVEFVRGSRATASAPAPEPPVQASAFAEFVGRLKRTADKKAAVDAFMAAQPAFPIVEGADRVHFVYRGNARDLALFVGSVSRQGADVMQRVPGTDFWYRSYRLEPGGRYDYQFQLNYDRLIADPLNPRRAPSPGEFSELVLPGWREPESLGLPAGVGPRGTLGELKFSSAVLDNTRKIQVYLPAGYHDGQERYPLLIVSGGDEALKFGAMDRVLDNMIGHGVEPVVVAFVTYAGGRIWRETGGPDGERYTWMLAHELIDFMQRKFRIRPGSEHRAVMGTGPSGYVSLLAALRFPDAFGKVATQSLYTHNRPVTDSLAALIASPGDTPQRIYMDWCSREMTDPGEGMDVRRDNTRLAGLLEQAGYEITAAEIAAGPGWGTWRTRTEAILKTLFPAGEATPRSR